mgnify:CR=1 FL=1
MKKKLSKGFTLVEILVVLVIVAILAGLAFVSYRGYVDKGYATEGIVFLEEVSSASKMYEDTHGGRQTTLDQLASEGYIRPSEALKKKWKVEISGEIFTATSSDEMDGGAGKEIRYDRNTGEYSGYGYEASE